MSVLWGVGGWGAGSAEKVMRFKGSMSSASYGYNLLVSHSLAPECH